MREKWLWNRPPSVFRTLAPECFEETFRQVSDVFAFGRMLFEIMTDKRLFAESLGLYEIEPIAAREGRARRFRSQCFKAPER